MTFASLPYLYLLWIVPLMVLLAIYAFRKKDRLIRQFADPELWPRLMPDASRRRQVFKFLLLLAAVCLILVAFLRPQWGFEIQEVQRRGVDILVAVDVSESMLAPDVSPNRLERAKREIVELVNALKGDRIGLIAFAGASFLECPLTLDYGTFKMFLDYVNTELIPVPGSDVAKAIKTAMEAFSSDRRSSRALILITDGEDHPKEAEKAAEEAGKKGIRIYTVGIGTTRGAPIPVEDSSGGFKKDRRGEKITTRLDRKALVKIASETGGQYVSSASGDMVIRNIYESLRESLAENELQSTQYKRGQERFQWFLFGGLLLICLEALLWERKRTAPRGWRVPFLRRLQPLLAVAVLLPLCRPGPVGAESVYSKIRKGENAYASEHYDEALKEFLDAQVEDPHNTLLKYNIGDTYYRMRNFAEAEAAFLDVAGSGDPVLEEKALYNLGNCAYRQGKLEEAVAYYQQALDRNEQDEDAKFNLEFVREEIKRRINEAKEREKQQEQQKQEQQQQGQTCSNPQQQPGSEGSENQEQQEQKQQEQQGRQEPTSESGEQQKEQATGEQEQEQQEAAAAQAQPEPTPEGAGQNEESEGTAAMQAAGEPGAPMTEQEAERWLNSLGDEQKDLAQQQIQKALGRGRPPAGKDW